MDYRVFAYLFLGALLVSCDSKKSVDADYYYGGGKDRIHIKIPAKYMPEVDSEYVDGKYVTSGRPIQLCYDFFTRKPIPNGTNGVVDGSTACIWFGGGSGRTDLLISGAVRKPGNDGNFQQYYGGGGSVYYVFKSKDGQLSSIDDGGVSAHLYIGRHNIYGVLPIKYLVSKGVGSDFRKIDESVAGFVSSFVTKAPE